MNLDSRGWHGSYGITERHTGMAVAAQIDNQPVGSETAQLYLVDEFALNIALEVAQPYVGETSAKFLHELFHCHGSVDLRFATPSEVEVRAVDNSNLFHLGKDESRPQRWGGFRYLKSLTGRIR